jgi:hypothetical protein
MQTRTEKLTIQATQRPSSTCGEREKGNNNKELFADLIGSFADGAKLARCFGIHISLSTPHADAQNTMLARREKGVAACAFRAQRARSATVLCQHSSRALRRDEMDGVAATPQPINASPMWPPLNIG